MKEIQRVGVKGSILKAMHRIYIRLMIVGLRSALMIATESETAALIEKGQEATKGQRNAKTAKTKRRCR